MHTPDTRALPSPGSSNAGATPCSHFSFQQKKFPGHRLRAPECETRRSEANAYLFHNEAAGDSGQSHLLRRTRVTGGLRWFVCAGRGRRTPVPTRRRCGSPEVRVPGGAASPARDTHAPGPALRPPGPGPRPRRSPLPAQTCRQLGSRAHTLSPHGPRLPSRRPQERDSPAAAAPVPASPPHPGAGGASGSSQSKSRAPRSARVRQRLWARAPQAASQEEASIGRQLSPASSAPVSILPPPAQAEPGTSLPGLAFPPGQRGGEDAERLPARQASNARPAAPCPVGRKPGPGDTHARASRLSQRASKPAGERTRRRSVRPDCSSAHRWNCAQARRGRAGTGLFLHVGLRT